MKATIGANGVLYIKAQNQLECYALQQWVETNIDGCTLQLKYPELVLLNIDTHIPKITLFRRIKLRIQLFLYK